MTALTGLQEAYATSVPLLVISSQIPRAGPGGRTAVPDDAVTYWDMTIAGYWAWSCWDARDGAFHSAQGARAGSAGAYGAALGGAHGLGRRVLAVNGDGGATYGIAELGVARQHDLPVTWLIVDDGGTGFSAST